VYISRSSFYDRFTPELVNYLHACVIHGLENIVQNPNRILKDKLVGFKDLLIQDSTIIRLHEKLADKWPAARTKKIAAGVKFSLLVSAVADGPKRIALCGERTSEMKTLRIGPWIKDRILLIDLGFYKHNTFARIDENGGYFVSRLKSKVDPLIIGTNRTWRGRSIDIVGKRLNEVLPKLKRKVIDVEDEKYHLYITNIPVIALMLRT
jgi:putative transposase